MGITINKIVESFENYSLVELVYGTESLVAQVWEEETRIKEKIGNENLNVEFQYDQLVNIEIIEDYKDTDSKISQENNNYLVKGRVSQFVKIENDYLIALFIQNGTEFLYILKSEIGDLDLKVKQGVKVELTNLRFYPTNI